MASDSKQVRTETKDNGVSKKKYEAPAVLKEQKLAQVTGAVKVTGVPT